MSTVHLLVIVLIIIILV